MHGGFGEDDNHTEHKPEHDQHGLAEFCDFHSEFEAYRHKPDLDRDKENYKPQKGVSYAYSYLD